MYVTEPFLNTAQGVQNIVIGTNECVSATRTRCPCLNDSGRLEEGMGHKYEEEDRKKSRLSSTRCTRYASAALLLLNKLTHYCSMSFSVGIVVVFIYAAFTV